jgi:hypothetical protein
MNTPREKRRGRPLKGSDRKAVRFNMRLEETEMEGFREAAALSGLDTSAWVRERLRAAAWKELEKAGRGVPFLAKRD